MTLIIEQNRSLKAFNTMAVEASAARFTEAHNDQEVVEALAEARRLGAPLWVLGGGSNLVLTADVDALVLRMASRGVRVLNDDGEQVVIEAAAGESWHPFVLHSLELGLSGLENLSLIPGTVGAAPIQNVGAYGVEIKDVFAGLTALDRETGGLVEFDLQACQFGYRDSLFKREARRYVILRVRFLLQRTANLKLEYGPLRQWLQQHDIRHPTPMDVSRAVCAIRSEKLPDPRVLGNAGSFFKNPLVPQSIAAALRARYPDLVAFAQGDEQVKLAAGWLIERAGWKGYRDGDAGVHRLQALVLVNYGQATGRQILDLARRIQADIAERFGVQLEIEPNVI
ncbi:UDP-N-acetylmuramate dehydrogenase [Stutzerimonas stutzeri]|uniref:UDP-N-acetylenolpyruvoylglucosamine reductase n=1 Tax=Stutzerimonas stutzeri TaxID=316 RepID=A0A0D9AIJ3_STUST|nr:UDP-N-acetylmuramate dehydrogenase [Stutzerimonas stutzeri]KJH80850.1 UDP-N-acetylenolpyruvoylglucosamine reductase [Stutzerimonas stutzeri]